MRGKSQKEAMHTDITDLILADFGTEDLNKIIWSSSTGNSQSSAETTDGKEGGWSQAWQNISKSRYKEDEVEQYRPKENVHFSMIEGKQMNEQWFFFLVNGIKKK